jgi:hypothetical protein
MHKGFFFVFVEFTTSRQSANTTIFEKPTSSARVLMQWMKLLLVALGFVLHGPFALRGPGARATGMPRI